MSKHILDAIAAGEAARAERLATEKAKAEAAAKQRAEAEAACDARERLRAEKWFADELPGIIERKTAAGERTYDLRGDDHLAAVCQGVPGLKVEQREITDYSYETGNDIGSHKEWVLSW